MAYQRKRYRALNEGGIIDFVKGKANDAASNIVKGAANSAVNNINSATGSLKIPPVSVGITKETKQMIYKAVGGLAVAGVAIAMIVKKR